MIRKCDNCKVEYDSEGHTLAEWLNLCHKCNIFRNFIPKTAVSRGGT